MKKSVSKTRQPNLKPFNLAKSNAWLLCCCQVLNLSVLMLELSAWMIAIISLCLCWQAFLIHRPVSKKNHRESYASSKKKRTISPMLLMLISIGGCIAIAISAKALGVLLSMLHLLTFAYTLKAFEIKQRKDFYQILLLGLFLLASALIFNQSLAFSLLIFVIFIFTL